MCSNGWIPGVQEKSALKTRPKKTRRKAGGGMGEQGEGPCEVPECSSSADCTASRGGPPLGEGKAMA